MSEHTPGPWDLTGNPNENPRFVGYIYDAAGNQIANIWPPEANARLMAAAPELLEALRVIMDSVDAQKARLDIYELELARQAIAEAEGR